MLTMQTFSGAPTIALRDPLLKILGPCDDGEITYGYADAVRAAGHSCPTVAGAFLMAAKGLAHLYPDGKPERGAVRVEMRADRAEGVTGVQARILSLILGAAEEDGFKGMLGRFDRRGLLAFNAPISGQVRLTRIDTGAAVELDYHPEAVPAFVSPRQVMQKILVGTATEEEKAAVRELWQNRVRNILTGERDNPALIVVSGPASSEGAIPADPDASLLRARARRYRQAARRAMTPEYRQRLSDDAIRIEQLAGTAGRSDVSSVEDDAASELSRLTAIHLRDRAAYCRTRAAAVTWPGVAASLRLAAEDYDRDAARLEQRCSVGHA